MAGYGSASRGGRMIAALKVTRQSRPYAAAMTDFTITRTEDGNVIALDPETGLSASGSTAHEAASELRRLIAGRQAA